MVALSLAAPLSATMVLPVGNCAGTLEMARSILHSIPVSGTGGNVFALALQHNGQIVLGGRFAQYTGTNRTFIARVFGERLARFRI